MGKLLLNNDWKMIVVQVLKMKLNELGPWFLVESPVFAYFNIQNFTWCPKSAYHIADSCIWRGTPDNLTVWCTFSNLFALYKTVKNVVLEIILILHPFLTTCISILAQAHIQIPSPFGCMPGNVYFWQTLLRQKSSRFTSFCTSILP